MAVTMKRACVAGAASRSRTVRVCAAKQDAPKLQSLAAGVAAAVLLSVAPANAGVIMEQPQLKKVLQDDSPSAPAPKREIILPGMRSKAAPATKDAAAPKAKATPKPAVTSGGDLDPRSVALPGTLALIAGGAFALTKVDEGFEEFMGEASCKVDEGFKEFMGEASCKDSGLDGAGYETALKGGAIAARKPAAGTKKVKAAAGKGSKAGTAKSSPLASFFDK
uniref:Uncharacterized protein n=1 Tax=Tetradesmus obliquus TaxID=3088 RepID=A0A383VHM4_TETOB